MLWLSRYSRDKSNCRVIINAKELGHSLDVGSTGLSLLSLEQSSALVTSDFHSFGPVIMSHFLET